MIKKNTSVKRNLHNIIGGEWLVAENNATGSIINLVPELPMSSPYRGNFQAVQIEDNQLNIINTAHAEEDSHEAAQSSGELLLRWTKIIKVPNEADKYIAQPKEKTVTVPALASCTATSNGWLYLKMVRLPEGGDISFSDEVLGKVDLQFLLQYATEIPDDSKTSSILPLAAVILNSDNEIEEIVQQQFGPGVLWIPDDVSEVSSSSEIPSSSSEIPESSSSIVPEDPDVPVIPDDSSSSVTTDEIIIGVELEYTEESTGDAMGTGVITQTSHAVLSGSFTAQTNYPANGYDVQLTGTIYYDYGDGETSNQEVSWVVNIFRNTTRSCWDVYHLKINDWAMYYNEKNSEFDTDFSTPVYTFPDLQSMPGYPIGSIQVDHHLVHGASNAVPDNDLTSSLVITFTRK